MVGIVADGESVLELALADEATELAELFTANINLHRLGYGGAALGVSGETQKIVEDLFWNIYGDSHEEIRIKKMN
jgi:hypothetical protein